MRVVYMGTPDFAVPALNLLAKHQLVAVFCQPDRPKGRSGKPKPCPVKLAALELDVPVYQPRRIRAKKWVTLLQELAPEVIVVAAFGQILPPAILQIPSIDCINIHASLLPRWRGASPIHHALLEGDQETGVAIMKMLEGLDTGPVYRLKRCPIERNISRLDLEKRLANMGACLLDETLPLLKELTPKPQSEQGVTYAPIIHKDFGFADFQHMESIRLERMARAFEAWPQLQCRFRNLPIKLLSVRALEGTCQQEPGQIVEVTRKKLIIACAHHSMLEICSLQPSGKKPQPVAAFINGYKPQCGEFFSAPLG